MNDDSLLLRDAVAAQLADLSAPDAPLNTDSRRNTTQLYATSVRRRVFRKTVIDRYLDSAPMPPREGCSALITAGPPGAGKSTLLSQQIADLQDYRRLDADEVKDHLLRQALDEGIYDDLLEHRLADGHPIAPRELAALVHHESTALIDQIRRICTDRHENVLIEGTLRWPDHGRRLLTELAAADYTSVRVLGVEVPRNLAHEQALQRWWTVRQQWTHRQDELGGRYTPPAAIDSCYPAAGQRSICADNAAALAHHPVSNGFEVTVTIYERDDNGSPVPADIG
ncbi:zeta toxin family protein [Rhodococcus sp. NPDC047139]|uniref:zeta toxin family protein n=1 Tax=Rhodococcus sp. NPDC047139 TaxID=3155141 RepID=UPI0033EDFC31